MGKNWEKLEIDLIISNKLNFKSDFIFSNGGSTLLIICSEIWYLTQKFILQEKIRETHQDAATVTSHRDAGKKKTCTVSK